MVVFITDFITSGLYLLARAVLRAVGITLEKFFVFGIVRQLGRQAEHGLGHRALGESIIWPALVQELKDNVSVL